MLGRYTGAYTDISKCIREIQQGLLVSIDPSIGSSSSMPGWAVYRASELIGKGEFEINPNHSLPNRLRALNNAMRKLYTEYTPDVLVYEDIPPLRQGGGNATAHASLLKALGAILCVPGPDHYVGIAPISWKKMVRETYRKGDMADAVEMGWIVIQESYRIHDEIAKRKSKGR